MRLETARQDYEVLLSFRQNQRRAALSHGLQDIVADHPITILVCNQLPIEIMKLQSFIRISLGHGTERCGTDMDRMCEWSLQPLRPSRQPDIALGHIA